MYNPLIALAAAAAVFVAAGLIAGGNSFRPLYGIVPAILVGLGLALYLARRSFKQVEAVLMRSQAIMQSAIPSTNPHVAKKQSERLIEKAVAALKEGYSIAKWQFWIKGQIDGQIGQLYMVGQRPDEAEPYLRGAMTRHWVAQGMLGALLYKRKKYDEMREVFERAVKVSKKEVILWNLYAWCLWKSNDAKAAIKVLNRATEHVGADAQTKENLNALQNDKKMKMRGWNMMWYQFGLEKPPQPRAPQIQGRRGRPR